MEAASHSDPIDPGSNEIWVSDSNGRTPVQLTHYGGPLTGTPRWSPDGMNIAFDTRPDAQADIYVVSSIGGTPRRVTKSEFEDVVPSWSSDGAWIYFASNRTGAWQVWRAPAARRRGRAGHDGGRFCGVRIARWAISVLRQGAKRRGFGAKSCRRARGTGAAAVAGRLLGILGGGRGRHLFRGSAGSAAPADFLLRPGTKKIRQVFKTDKPLAVTDSAFAVSPERRHILYTQVDQSGSDIFILDHR